jgi:hypothetical protein
LSSKQWGSVFPGAACIADREVGVGRRGLDLGGVGESVGRIEREQAGEPERLAAEKEPGPRISPGEDRPASYSCRRRRSADQDGVADPRCEAGLAEMAGGMADRAGEPVAAQRADGVPGRLLT